VIKRHAADFLSGVATFSAHTRVTGHWSRLKMLPSTSVSTWCRAVYLVVKSQEHLAYGGPVELASLLVLDCKQTPQASPVAQRFCWGAHREIRRALSATAVPRAGLHKKKRHSAPPPRSDSLSAAPWASSSRPRSGSSTSGPAPRAPSRAPSAPWSSRLGSLRRDVGRPRTTEDGWAYPGFYGTAFHVPTSQGKNVSAWPLPVSAHRSSLAAPSRSCCLHSP
jgi:hypothetical protein